MQVPRNPQDRDISKCNEVQNVCVRNKVTYFNRAAKAAWLAVTLPMYSSRASALVAALQFITGEYGCSARFPRDRTITLQAPQIVAELAVLSQDLDLGTDLRRLNGRPANPAFDAFWAKAQSLLEEYKRVDDRRHGECNVCVFSLACYTLTLSCDAMQTLSRVLCSCLSPSPLVT